MEPLSLVVALAVGFLAKVGMDQLLKKIPALASLNEKLKHVYREHEPEIRAGLSKKFNPTAVELVCNTVSKRHLSKEDVAHLEKEDPRLYREFLHIASRYDPEITPLTESIRSELT
jgi:hypothetical protein